VDLPLTQRMSLEGTGDAAVILSAQILRSIPPEIFDRIARDATEREFFGPAAKDYLELHLTLQQSSALKTAGDIALEQFSSVVQQLKDALESGSAGTTTRKVRQAGLLFDALFLTSLSCDEAYRGDHLNTYERGITTLGGHAVTPGCSHIIPRIFFADSREERSRRDS